MTPHMDESSGLNDGGKSAGDDVFDGRAKTMPLTSVTGTAEIPEVDEFESDPVRSGKSLLNQGTLLIALLLGVAAAIIYGMRVSQGEIHSAASTVEAEAKIDQALARLSKSQALPDDDPLKSGNINKLFRDTDLIISMFSSDLTSQQVPIESLQCNPFILTRAKSEPAIDTQPVSPYRNQRHKKAQQRMQELNKELAGLQLQTVIIGNVNVAVINDDLYQTNHTVGSFKVTKISKMAVDFEADGRAFSLTMSQ